MRIWHPRTPMQAVIVAIGFVLAASVATVGGAMAAGPIVGGLAGFAVCALIPIVIR